MHKVSTEKRNIPEKVPKAFRISSSLFRLPECNKLIKIVFSASNMIFQPIALISAIITISAALELLPDLEICLDEVFSDGLSHPTHAEYTKGFLLVAEREGIIKEVRIVFYLQLLLSLKSHLHACLKPFSIQKRARVRYRV